MRSMGTSRTRLFSASLIALALLLPGSTQAQSAGNGLTNLIDSIFSGPNAATPPQARPGRTAPRRRGAGKTAPPAIR